MKIGIISGTKASDAYLCGKLLATFPGSIVICYKIPPRMWLPWLGKRIKTLGLSTFIGHIFLSAFLRLERGIDRVRDRTIWKKFGLPRPTWLAVPHAQFSLSEELLAENLQGVDCIVATDTFRYSPDLFKQLKKPFIQVVWGATPDYFGDSGAFWAFAQGQTERIGVSLILRHSQFQYYHPLAWMPITVDQNDTIRTIKIKQVIALSEQLPQVIESVHTMPVTNRTVTKISCRNWYAPTLTTLVHFWRDKKRGKPVSIPSYAYRDYTGFVF